MRTNAWTRDELHGDGDIELTVLDTRLSLDQIYEDVRLPPLAVGEGDDDFEWAEAGEDN